MDVLVVLKREEERLEQFNATVRCTVVADGLTEANNNYPSKMQPNLAGTFRYEAHPFG